MTPEERKNYIALGHTGSGWLPIIERLDDRLSEIDPNYDINQIKQKFGGLRYYFFSTKADEMYDLVVQAEHEAWRTCECCGTTDGVTTNPHGHIETLCQECREKLCHSDKTFRPMNDILRNFVPTGCDPVPYCTSCELPRSNHNEPCPHCGNI